MPAGPGLFMYGEDRLMNLAGGFVPKGVRGFVSNDGRRHAELDPLDDRQAFPFGCHGRRARRDVRIGGLG